MNVVTLLFLRRDDELLLAMKKRGHGQGKYNGVGGKVEPWETVHASVIRECEEEIDVTPVRPRLIGRLHFYELNDPGFYHNCHVFVADKWEGEPKETEEMRPKWFHIDGVPYARMWADDILWLPHLLQGRRFKGKVTLDGDRIHHHDITVHNSRTTPH